MPRTSLTLRLLIPLTACALAGACSSLVASSTARLAGTVERGLLDQTDPELVRQAAPAYLVLLDGLIAESPDDPDLLAAGASLATAYAGAFVDDPERARRLTARGRGHGLAALCAQAPQTCGFETVPYERFERALAATGERDLEALYAAGSSWASWIQARRGDWTAMGDAARVEAIMRRVVALDDRFADGEAHLYLGTLASLLPAALGGRPEEGRRHFERAFELSGGRNLYAKVLLAREYARLTFDRDLHDRLLREVLAADPAAPGLTLVNVLAQEEAQRLLDDSESYFGE